MTVTEVLIKCVGCFQRVWPAGKARPTDAVAKISQYVLPPGRLRIAQSFFANSTQWQKSTDQSKFKFQDVPITNISSAPCAISLVFRGEHESRMRSGQEERKTRAIGHTLVVHDPDVRHLHGHLTRCSSFDRLLRRRSGPCFLKKTS